MEFSPILIWFIVGVVMILMEFVIPGLIVIFFGGGAWVTAILVAIFPAMPLWVQMLIFAVFSVVCLVFLRRSLKKRFFSGQEDLASEQVDDYIGRRAVVEKAITRGEGKVIFRGAAWDAFADEDIPEGTAVTIIDKDSIRLKVKPIK
jgi:membrane protein implicated in regulation of membrane protease activity